MEVKNPGKSDQITRDYLDSLLLEMRHLDSKKPDTTLRLYGEVFDTPIMMAALSHLNNIHTAQSVNRRRKKWQREQYSPMR